MCQSSFRQPPHLLLLALTGVILVGCTGKMNLVSISTSGEQGNGRSHSARISANGRFVAFVSDATNFISADLLGPDGTAGTNVYVRDLGKDTTDIVSLAHDGALDGSVTGRPDISADGRFIVWSSTSAHLVSNDANGREDIFLRDRNLNRTMRISMGTDYSIGAQDVESNGNSRHPSISPDGAMIAFESDATNLFIDTTGGYAPDDTNGVTDVFVRSFVGITGQSVLPTDPSAIPVTDRVSFRHPNSNWEVEQVNAASRAPAIGAATADGRNVGVVLESLGALSATQTDSNGISDIYQKPSGQQFFGLVSNGLAAESDGPSIHGALGNKGLTVAYATDATNISVTGSSATDSNGVRDVMITTANPIAENVYVLVTERATDSESGIQADGDSDYPALSWEGEYVAFESIASNIVDGRAIGNGMQDVILRNNTNGKLMVVSRAYDLTSDADGRSRQPSASNRGERVAFESDATNLIDPSSADADRNGLTDVYVYYRFLKSQFWLWPFDFPFQVKGELD